MTTPVRRWNKVRETIPAEYRAIADIYLLYLVLSRFQMADEELDEAFQEALSHAKEFYSHD